MFFWIQPPGKDHKKAPPKPAKNHIASKTLYEEDHQQILAHETGVADVVDPMGGSHLVETMTISLLEEAQKLIQRIDSMGGMVSAIEQGFPQREIQDSAYKTQLAIENKDQIVIGVNSFETAQEEPGELLRPDPEVEQTQKQRLGEIKTTKGTQIII